MVLWALAAVASSRRRLSHTGRLIGIAVTALAVSKFYSLSGRLTSVFARRPPGRIRCGLEDRRRARRVALARAPRRAALPPALVGTAPTARVKLPRAPVDRRSHAAGRPPEPERRPAASADLGLRHARALDAAKKRVRLFVDMNGAKEWRAVVAQPMPPWTRDAPRQRPASRAHYKLLEAARAPAARRGARCTCARRPAGSRSAPPTLSASGGRDARRVTRRSTRRACSRPTCSGRRRAPSSPRASSASTW